MNQDDSDQDKLQQALATLRHRPPPRDLSAQVRSRLENPQPPPPPTLLQRMGCNIEGRPVLVGLAGVAVLLLVVVVVMASRHVEPPAEGPAMATPALLGPPNGTPVGPGQYSPPAAPDVVPGALPSSATPILVTPVEADRVPVRGRP